MNQVTKWYENRIYRWMDYHNFPSMKSNLDENCREDLIRDLIREFPKLRLESVQFYKQGTYQEAEKTTLDNIPDFYEIRMSQQVSKNHKGSFRIYLPVYWNQRYMGISGAGTNNEVDWFSSVRFNVISWPMSLMNGYACAVSDNDTGIRLDCTWGFDAEGNLERDHIEAWAHETLHETTVCAKKLIAAIYGKEILASYIHGTSGGARQVVTEAIRYPGDFDGHWADAPSIDHLNLPFACVWAAVVEANEKHIVSISKYAKARELALADPALYNIPFSMKEYKWMNFVNALSGMETKDGPISRRDLQIMVKTWEGPFTKEGKRMAYGYGPTIRQWPVPNANPLYGYYRRNPETGKYLLMPIAEQFIRWFTNKPDLDIHSLSYDAFENIYKTCRKSFERYAFNESDFSKLAQCKGKIMITHGTGDCVVPYQQMINYYMSALDAFPSEKMMNETFRLYMPPMAGHSILDWTGPAISIADGLTALTKWVEEEKAPDVIDTMFYDFAKEEVLENSTVESFNQWKYKKTIKNYR